MATYTSNYGWTKPSGSDNVDISVLNNNLDDQDSTIHDAFLNMAPPFSESSTYAVDDIVLYGTGLYKCHTAVVTPGSWTGSTNWQVHKLSEGGSGGGGYVLPTATASRLGGVKIGSGINVEEDGTISAGGGGSSLEAGDYIEIDENDKINVKMEKGDTTEYEYRFTGAYSPVNQLTIEKYRDGVLVSTESYRNDASYTPIAIDGLFEIWYSAGNPRYYWCYKLLEDSQEHSAGYEDSWYYTDTTTRTETFDVEDDSLTLVRKGDLEEAVDGLTQIMGNVKMAKLWENPNPTSTFSTQDITLSSDEYDLLLFVFKASATTSRCCSEITVKGSGATLSIAEYSSNAASNRTRYMSYRSNTVFNVSGGYINGTSDNSIIIPYQIYGIKLT